MNFIKKRPLLILSFILFSISVLIRYQVYSLSNEDVDILLGWYKQIFKYGKTSLGNGEFSNYTPAYLYLMYIARLFSRWLDGFATIKIIPTIFDLISVLAIYLLARLRFDNDRPYLLAAIFFTLPTIMFNSTGWGQIDSLYTSFLLLCVYFLLKEKPFYAMLMFGVAFSFKSQSVFLLPFLGIMFLKGKINWYHFFVIPVVYIILAIPSVALGRSWLSVLTIYTGQVGQFTSLSMSAPNLYVFISDAYYEIGVWVGMIIFVCAMIIWGWVNWRAKVSYDNRKIMLMALSALALVPFVLPKMHERYFYPVDVFSYALVIFDPRMWFVPILCQIISALSYSVFIWNASSSFVMIAAIINTGTVLYILRKQYLSLSE